MIYKVIPEDFISKLDRIKAELARRNGYGDVSAYADIDFPEGTPITYGSLITTPVFNTLLTALNYINGSGLPDEAVGGVTKINTDDFNVVDAIISAFEAQPRSATSNNDCAAQCTGMCVLQCTTTCISTCTGSCSETCSGGCADTCGTSCTGSCAGACTSCTGSCSGSCSSCTGGCTGTCTAACKSGCGNACSFSCVGSCKNTCSTSCVTVSATGG